MYIEYWELEIPTVSFLSDSFSGFLGASKLKFMYLNVKWSKLNVDSSFLLTCKQRLNHLLAYVKRLSTHSGAPAILRLSGRKGRCPWQHSPPDGNGIPGWSSRARSISHIACPVFSPPKAEGQGRAAWRECLTGPMSFVCENECSSTAGLSCSLTLRCPLCRTHTAL